MILPVVVIVRMAAFATGHMIRAVLPTARTAAFARHPITQIHRHRPSGRFSGPLLFRKRQEGITFGAAKTAASLLTQKEDHKGEDQT